MASFVEMPMSGAHSRFPHPTLPDTNPVARLSALVRAAVRTVAFWLAVVFPLTYLPLLGDGVAGGDPLLVVGLLAGHALLLTLGHDHAR
jgi:hypothetical protein